MEQNILKLADSLEKTACGIRESFYQAQGEEALEHAINPGGIFYGKWAKTWDWYIQFDGTNLALFGHAPESAKTELGKIWQIKNRSERLTLALDLNVQMCSDSILSLWDSKEYREFAAYHEIEIEHVNTDYPAHDYRGIYNLVCDQLDALDAKRRHLGELLYLMNEQLKREADDTPF